MTLSQQGSARAPQKRDLEEKPWRYVVGLPWKSRLKSALKTPYIQVGGRGGGSLTKPKRKRNSTFSVVCILTIIQKTSDDRGAGSMLPNYDMHWIVIFALLVKGKPPKPIMQAKFSVCDSRFLQWGHQAEKCRWFVGIRHNGHFFPSCWREAPFAQDKQRESIKTVPLDGHLIMSILMIL